MESITRSLSKKSSVVHSPNTDHTSLYANLLQFNLLACILSQIFRLGQAGKAVRINIEESTEKSCFKCVELIMELECEKI